MNARRLLAIPIAVALASVAAANLVFVSEQHLAPGTSFDVQGTDFGRRPTVWLDLAGRRIPLRVARGATSTELRATLASLPSRAHGECLLKLRPRGARVTFNLAGLTIEQPTPDSVAPSTAARGSEVTILGQFFGVRRGRVEIGGRRAKVVSWSPTEIHALVPKALVPGMAYVYVTNRTGTSDEIIGFAVP